MILRPATETDAQVLFDWRNDFITRQSSRNTAVVLWEDHLRWLMRSLTQPNRELLIAECNGEAVGTVRLDYSESDCELSWTVAPDRRQQGISKEMVRLAVQRVRPGVVLKAEIKTDNEPSQRIIRALGFTEEQHRNGLAMWSYIREDD
jgi:RimJ/RimL family protein N-acetyltransferase